MRLVASILSIFLYLPIWFYLLYHILSKIEASELAWFLYWVYIPIGVLSSILFKVSEDDKK